MCIFDNSFYNVIENLYNTIWVESAVVTVIMSLIYIY